MTATLERPTTQASVWAKSLPALPRAAAAPHGPTSTAYIAQWLAILADDPGRGGEFDRELEQYAASLRAAGNITEHQGAGFLLALFAYQSVGHPLVPVLCQQVDRRAALRGVVHCPWRGDIPRSVYEATRYDEALRRSKLPNKGEEGYQKRRD